MAASYFNGYDISNGQELWKSDGTTAGTVQVKDIKPGPGSSIPSSLANLNGTLLFQANDGTTGIELWKSDGSAAGTNIIRDANTAPIQAIRNSSSAWDLRYCSWFRTGYG